GLWVAEELHRRLALTEPLGSLNISFYRDDFSRIGLHPEVQPSELPISVEGRHILLVDDVLHTGRTIRAAMNEIFDYGRPAAIILAALAVRSGRELPIEANCYGVRLPLSGQQHVRVSNPGNLQLNIVQRQKESA
ncbi:MAG: bifunctional pyr operon transcriptional regulator/uracil phosphoribosyltransferase PyrR, partial [gamma proteobacterium symbiont of Bathyaustriella thionipta]|nr:bifunctional pyr operon transcriptional regulator/uracil phosphoribosyltransferase PyrR [gamma proteobacterium symbiont of Bathyaustriella thionipta]